MSLLSPRHALVDRHFAALNSAHDDSRMWRHLAQCARCRTRYRHQSLLETLDAHGALSAARERLGRSLFQAPARAVRPLRAGLWAGLPLAAAALTLTLFWPSAHDPFQPRGAPLATRSLELPSVALFQLQEQARPARVGSLLQHDAALAIAYRNPGHKPFSHLMVFARDAQGHIYWFAPLWQDARENPSALTIAQADTALELEHAVRHRLPLGRLQLVALFSRAPYTVREIEAQLARDPASLEALPNVHVVQRPLQVER